MLDLDPRQLRWAWRWKKTVRKIRCKIYLSSVRVGKHPELGENLARKIEAAMCLSVGWMDHPHSAFEEDEGTDAKTGTLQQVALERRLLELWGRLSPQRQQVFLDLMEDAVMLEQLQSKAKSP